MDTRTFVYVRTQFTAFHRWVDAPDKVRFLRDFHRHVFNVKLMVDVGHDNRDVEFFILKGDLDVYLRTHYHGEFFEFSCEQIAKMIIEEMTRIGYSVRTCEVNEDNENGAVVITNPTE